MDADFRAAFDYIYFTEGDQILLTRKLPQIFSFLTANPYTVRVHVLCLCACLPACL